MQRHQYIGNLTKDPERSVTNAGTELVRFDIAVNTPIRSGERKTDFVSVTVFKDVLQRFAMNYLRKGSGVWIESNTLTAKVWHKRDGTEVASLQIIANDIQTIGRGVGESVHEVSDAAEPTDGGNGSWEPQNYQQESVDEDTPW